MFFDVYWSVKLGVNAIMQKNLKENRDWWPKAKLFSSTPSFTRYILYYDLGFFLNAHTL